MPHTLEWFDHANPPRRGTFEHFGNDMLDPYILGKFAETVLQQAGVSYEPPIRVIYTGVDYQALSQVPPEQYWPGFPLPPSHIKDSSV